jgi:hypothetical protein
MTYSADIQSVILGNVAMTVVGAWCVRLIVIAFQCPKRKEMTK